MTTLDQRTSIDERLDRLSEQVEAIAAELRRQRQEREKYQELTRDVTPVLRSALDSVGRELDELSAEVSLADAVAFLEELARALPTLRAAITQLEGFAELAGEVSDLSRPVMELLAERLGELDEKGYFDFARSGLGVIDRIVTGFSEDDVEALGDNVVLILNTIKDMTQPEVMTMLRRTVSVVREDQAAAAAAPPPSLFSLLREMRDPQVRRGLARVLDMLRSAAPDTTTDDNRQEVRHGDSHDRGT